MNTQTVSQESEIIVSQSEMPDRDRVAQGVLSRILCNAGGLPSNPLLITDGKSAASVSKAYFPYWTKHCSGKLRVWTNSIEPANQITAISSAAEKISVHQADGEFDTFNKGVFGLETEQWMEKHAPRCTCILAVTALDADLGPCGQGEDPRAIKSAVIKSANVLIVVADRLKLRFPKDPAHAAAPDEWKRWTEERAKTGRLYVVTTYTPGLDLTHVPRDRAHMTAAEIEVENIRKLRQKLGANLILV